MINFSNLFRLIDENAQRLLVLASGAVTAFFISFVMVLAQANSAHAQETCNGSDLIAKYEKDDPAKLADLRAQASKIANGQGVFWKIEKDGVEPSWLLGTMHMADARIAKLDEKKSAAFNASNTVIVENIEALDPKQAQAALLEHKDMTLYTDGTNLAQRLDPETLNALKRATEKRGMPFQVVQIMQPWLIATSLALPACEMAAKQAGNPVLDSLIGQKAKEEGKTLIGLETIGEQFSAMYSLPEDFHIAALKETLKMGALAEDVIETMKILYLQGEIGMIQPLTKVVSPNTTQNENYKDFNANLISNRNHVMAERSIKFLEAGNAFVAVGALHLPGDEGLVELYRKAGFTLTKAD